MKRFAFFVALFLFSATTQAQGERAAKATQAGLGFELLPIGQFTVRNGNVSVTTDATMAYGLAPFLDFAPAPYFTIGVAPRFLLNVKPQDVDDSATQLDLRARAMGHLPIAPAARLYGYVAPGYSIMYPPDWPEGLSLPSGFILALAGGGSYDFDPSGFVTLEIGYQFGWQSVTDSGMTIELSDDFFHVGAAVGTRF
jgi:hypothetical protein